MRRGSKLLFVLLLTIIILVSLVYGTNGEDCSMVKCPGAFWNDTAGECQCPGIDISGESASCSNSTLHENETLVLYEYGLSISFISDIEVQIEINETTTNMLSEGEEQVFDNYSIEILDILYSGMVNVTNNVSLSFCIFEESNESDVDLVIGSVDYNNISVDVEYCNPENGSANNFSIRLDKDENNTYTTGNVLNLNDTCDIVEIDKSLINFSEGDIITVTVDANDTVVEMDEENNDLEVICTGGSCISYIEPSCSESDGGMDYLMSGSTTYTDSFGSTRNDDVCVGDVLTEYFCNGTIIESVNETCSWGCSDGACEPREPVVDYGDSKGYAMDHETNLFWQRESVSGKTWNDARNYCEAANFGGYIDWRLPTLEELEEFYPASLGANVASFLSGGHYVGSTSSIEVSGYVYGNNVVTGVGARAKSGDVDRVRLEIKELQGCTMGPSAYAMFGSGLERWVEAPDGYVVTGVGMGCVDDCNVKNLAIYVKKLDAPCSLGSDTKVIYHGSKGPERFYRAPEGYVVTGVTARAKPGDIRGIRLGYREIQLLPEEKYMDIEVGARYWSSNSSATGRYVMVWDDDGTSMNSSTEVANSNNVICVRDGRITPEQKSGVSSCQMCVKHKSEGYTALGLFGSLFGFNKPYQSNWECTGFDDTPLLNNFECPVTGVFAGGACDINDDDTLKLKVGCGDTSLTDTCQLCRRYADFNGRDNAPWDCIGFNGLSLNTDFVGDVNEDDDFDLMANCSDALIRDNCQLCRRHPMRDSDWECVDFDGTPLLTDFTTDVDEGYALDLKVRCDIEIQPSCLDEDDGADFYTKAACTDAQGDVNWDYCNGTTLTEFTCGGDLNCTSQEVDCAYGCLDGACLPRVEKNDAYFVLNRQGDFELQLNEIIGENHDLAGVDFRNTRFRLIVDSRRLSAITANTGYTEAMVSSDYDINDYANINSIQRHNLESYSAPDRVPETVFAANGYDIDVMENQTTLDISEETDDEIYLFVDESLDQYSAPGVIHSSRTEDEAEVTSAPSKSSFVDDGVVNTYGNVFSAYVDFYGNLIFKYETQNQNSRAVAMVGVLACECSPGEERCDGSDYLICEDGCGWTNNGEVVGECGVRLVCSGEYDEFDEATTIGYENDLVVNRTDICVNETHLQEYSCLENDDVTSTIVECQLGCSNGACIDCIDSDAKDYSTLGSVQGRDLSGTLFDNESDRCIADTLVERICTNGFLDSTFFDCPNGCFEGKCIMVECSVAFGNVSECGKTSYNVDGVLFCDLYNGSKYEFDLYNASECEHECSEGVCEVVTCDDNDLGIYENVSKSTANDSLGNVIEDVCANDEYLSEGVCKNGVAVAEERYCSRGCQNGKCIGESNCNDTDGGLDYYEAGVTTSCVGLDCVTGENESCNNGLLWESYCGKNNKIIWQQIECPAGCNESTNRTCSIPEEQPSATCPPVVIGGPEIGPGTRLLVNGTLSYCDPFTLSYLPVKPANTSCINDYECEGNVCADGVCFEIRVELETQREILEEQTTLLQEIRCWLRDFVGVQDYDECLNESLGG